MENKKDTMKKNAEIQRVGSTKAGTWEILK